MRHHFDPETGLPRPAPWFGRRTPSPTRRGWTSPNAEGEYYADAQEYQWWPYMPSWWKPKDTPEEVDNETA